MIRETIYSVDLEDIEKAKESIPENDRTTINRPITSYFYDEWELKDEYRGTIWEKIYNSLPYPKGEARLITLDRGVNYYSHADIDDRWHLNIRGEQAYLIDLDNKIMHRVEEDGIWYDMDAGRLHVAANFGSIPRTQLVVRQLLTHSELKDRVSMTITLDISKIDSDARYRFDHKLSPWLNRANKRGLIDNFNFNGTNIVKFDVERQFIDKVQELLPFTDFNIIISC